MTPLEPIRRHALLATSAGLDEPGASEWIQVELADAWRAAEDEATRAYRHWFETSDRIASRSTERRRTVLTKRKTCSLRTRRRRDASEL